MININSRLYILSIVIILYTVLIVINILSIFRTESLITESFYFKNFYATNPCLKDVILLHLLKNLMSVEIKLLYQANHSFIN